MTEQVFPLCVPISSTRLPTQFVRLQKRLKIPGSGEQNFDDVFGSSLEVTLRPLFVFQMRCQILSNKQQHLYEFYKL